MQIKLRAWDEETKTYYRELFGQGLTIGCIYGNKISICREYDDHIQELQPLLFTGKKDKNGAEIYEGDIVHVRDLDMENGIDLGNYEVIFESKGFGLAYSAGYLPYYESYMTLEVIGNRFEQPELLEEKT